MDSLAADEAIASIIKTMDRGQYLLLVTAILAAGGEVRIDVEEFARMASVAVPKMQVDLTDGPLILRVSP